MIKSFEELYESLLGVNPINLVVAAAEDEDVILSVKEAMGKGLVNPILVGNQIEIENICKRFTYDPKNFKIVNTANVDDTIKKSMELMRDGQGDVLMKGLVHTSSILKGVLKREYGLRDKSTLSHVFVSRIEDFSRMIYITDASMNISPDVDTKEGIINNAVELAHLLGNPCPKVGAVCGVEYVYDKMPATLDAQELVNRYKEGRFTGCTVSGPFALDNALSKRSAKIKGIEDPYAGESEILLMPNLEAGNILFKGLAYLAPSELAGIIMGAKVPIVLTSRSDTAVTKLNSIALAVYLIKKKQSIELVLKN